MDERNGRLERIVVQPLSRGCAELLELRTCAEHCGKVSWSIDREALSWERERPDGFEIGMPPDCHIEVGGRPAPWIGGRQKGAEPIVGVPLCQVHADESADQPTAERRHSYGHDLPP